MPLYIIVVLYICKSFNRNISLVGDQVKPESYPRFVFIDRKFKRYFTSQFNLKPEI